MSTRTSLALLAFLAFISLGLPDGLLGVAWPSIRREFGVPLDALGLLLTFATAGYLTSSFLSGRILRVLPIGSVLALSTAAAATALLGFAFSPFWPLIIACGFLAGLGGGAVDAGLNAYGATNFTPRILNWLHAFFGLGTTLGPLVVTAVLEAGLAWRWSYLVVGLAQVVLAGVFFLSRGRWRRSTDPEGAAPVVAARTRDTLRRPRVLLGMLLFFVYTGVELVVGVWSYTLLTIGRGVPEGTAGVFVSLYWGSLMVGRVLFGFVAHRVPLVPALRVCMLAVLAGACLLWLAPAASVALLGLMVTGFFIAPVFASLVSLTPARVGAEHADSAIGFQVASAGLGGALLTSLVGVLADANGLEYVGAAVVVFVLMLLGLFEATLRTARRPAPAGVD